MHFIHLKLHTWNEYCTRLNNPNLLYKLILSTSKKMCNYTSIGICQDVYLLHTMFHWYCITVVRITPNNLLKTLMMQGHDFNVVEMN